MGEAEFGLQELAARLRCEDCAHLAAGKEAATENQQRDEEGEGYVTVLDAALHERGVAAIDKVPQGLVAVLLHPVHGHQQRVARRFAVRKVGGKNPLGLEQ